MSWLNFPNALHTLVFLGSQGIDSFICVASSSRLIKPQNLSCWLKSSFAVPLYTVSQACLLRCLWKFRSLKERPPNRSAFMYPTNRNNVAHIPRSSSSWPAYHWKHSVPTDIFQSLHNIQGLILLCCFLVVTSLVITLLQNGFRVKLRHCWRRLQYELYLFLRRTFAACSHACLIKWGVLPELGWTNSRKDAGLDCHLYRNKGTI